MSEEHKEQSNHDLVVVGSSAGGVGALSVFVSTLPKDFPAPVVLAQHLDPQRPSNLGAILERRSTLPVVQVRDQEPSTLEAGKVYVVPANRHVTINDGFVHLEGDHEGRPRPSVDLLLSTAAHSYGEHLYAVILTGTGSDGAAGAVEVKHGGGVVIIQNPETAQYPSMPMSLPPTAVDHVLELEQIGPLLYDLITGVNLPTFEKAEDPLRDLLAYVTRQSNIDFHTYKPTTITRRIARRMAVNRITSIRDYAQYLESNAEEVQELVKAFLIKVTGFFRDPEAFEFLRDSLLPLMIEQGRQQGRVLRFWSAGCATGEEPYTFALLVADLLGPELPEWSVKIFATDLDDGALNFARRGFYPANVLKDLPDMYLEHFFEPSDQGYHIAKSLRQMVIFGQQDLTRGVPFPRISMVTCRNLLIYLKPDLQQRVLDLFAYSLHQTNGYLFLGKAETARPGKGTFETVNKKWKIYRCLSGPMAVPAVQDAPRFPIQTVHTFPERQSINRRAVQIEKQLNAIEAMPLEPELIQLRRFNEVMLRHLPVGVVVIDRYYRIITSNSTARRLLGIRDITTEQDFLHTVRGLPYKAVRNGIDTTFREHGSITLPDVELEATSGVAKRYVHLQFTVMQMEHVVSDLAIISIMDATEQVQTKRRLEAVQAEQSQLVEELSASNARFSEMNKELQDSNEELQAANEELMLTQEELQATNEEFEATNEELQATNEELETNNEELQATNEELQTTNDELTARTSELQDLTREIIKERKWLAEMVESSPFLIMLLKGPSLLVSAFNSGYAALLQNRQIVGHPFEEVFSGIEMPDFTKNVREAYEHDAMRRTPRMRTHVPNGRGEKTESFFVHTVVPVHDGEGKVDGVVIYTEMVNDNRKEPETEN
ncbi:MAG TPA: chemotaxis protein CheB [Pyrinomonadaceae bacterium]